MRKDTEWRQRVFRKSFHRVDLLNGLELDDYDIPKLHAYYGELPKSIIDWKTAKSHKNCTFNWIHFFIDDASFEDVWNPKYTNRDLDILCNFAGIITPDFSLLPNMTYASKVFNVQRNRTIGQILQRRGQNVIPSISWAERESFNYCFKGIPLYSTVAISTNGVFRNTVTKKLFFEGFFEMERVLHPTSIIVFGEKIDLQTMAKLVFFPSKQILRLRGLIR